MHTSAAVCAMFKGYTGYLQADAHAVYDALFAGRAPRGQPPDPDASPSPREVGCWSHPRCNFWEAAGCKHALGVEGLRRLDALFAADRRLADLAPAARKAQREAHVRPVVDAFVAWVCAEHARPRERGLDTTTLGYVLHQEGPLRRFLEDGRLKLDNNAAERHLRGVATTRSFYGSSHRSCRGPLSLAPALRPAHPAALPGAASWRGGRRLRVAGRHARGHPGVDVRPCVLRDADARRTAVWDRGAARAAGAARRPGI